jgi:thiol-disulfide isomerase/thioredoxin
MNKLKYYFLIIILLSTIITIVQTTTAEEDKDVILEFFYTKGCDLCNQTKPIISELETSYDEKITVDRFLVIKNVNFENYTYFSEHYGFRYVPAVVVLNQTDQVLFNHSQINKEDIEKAINSMLPEVGSDSEVDPSGKKKDSTNILLYVVIILIPAIAILFLILIRRTIKRK